MPRKSVAQDQGKMCNKVSAFTALWLIYGRFLSTKVRDGAVKAETVGQCTNGEFRRPRFSTLLERRQKSGNERGRGWVIKERRVKSLGLTDRSLWQRG